MTGYRVMFIILMICNIVFAIGNFAFGNVIVGSINTAGALFCIWWLANN